MRASDKLLGTMALSVVTKPENMAKTAKAGKGPIHVAIISHKLQVSHSAVGKVFVGARVKNGWRIINSSERGLPRVVSDKEAARLVQEVFDSADSLPLRVRVAEAYRSYVRNRRATAQEKAILLEGYWAECLPSDPDRSPYQAAEDGFPPFGD